MRLAVYVDDVYRRDGNVLTAGLAFPVFAAGLVGELEAVTLLGRLDPVPGRSHHVLPPDVGFVALPYYANLNRPLDVARSMTGAVRRFWRALATVDAIWLLGPHPLAFVVAGLAALRRRRVVLGVRQHTAEYAAHRHPDSRPAQLALVSLERVWRLLARALPVVVVGPDLAAAYSRAPRLLDLVVSFVDEADIASPEAAAARRYDGEIRVLSVGRIDPEKNPLLLADVLAELTAAGRNVRMVICGEGSLVEPLVDRLHSLGVGDRAELLGYVPIDDGLKQVYRSSHVFLHTSWTEGVPQVLLEAFAARLPIVATDVGSVAAIASDAALLIRPGNVRAATTEIERIVTDAQLRERLTAAAAARARLHTRDAQLKRLAHWLCDAISERP